jgi:hypothetical protein
MQPDSSNRINKHIPTATNMHATREGLFLSNRWVNTQQYGLLETVFSVWSLQSGYNEEFS